MFARVIIRNFLSVDITCSSSIPKLIIEWFIDQFTECSDEPGPDIQAEFSEKSGGVKSLDPLFP